MKHPKRFCTSCDKEEFLTIKAHKTYSMYHCRRCGDEVGRVGDGETQHQRLTVRGGIDAMSLSEDAASSANLTDLALGNPDVLSDEHSLWQPRDYEQEAQREDDLRTFRVALSGLTARQKQVLDAVNRFGTHDRAAAFLGMTRQNVGQTIKDIAKKLAKKGCLRSKSGLIGEETI